MTERDNLRQSELNYQARLTFEENQPVKLDVTADLPGGEKFQKKQSAFAIRECAERLVGVGAL
jgi:hypothetical protein